jgi:hypothetical protein
MILFSFPLNVKVAHFPPVLWVDSVFSFCEAGCFLFCLYYNCYVMYFLLFSSFSLAYLGIGYLFNLFIR